MWNHILFCLSAFNNILKDLSMSSQQLVNEANIIKNQSNLFLLRYSNMNFNLFFAFLFTAGKVPRHYKSHWGVWDQACFIWCVSNSVILLSDDLSKYNEELAHCIDKPLYGSF